MREDWSKPARENQFQLCIWFSCKTEQVEFLDLMHRVEAELGIWLKKCKQLLAYYMYLENVSINSTSRKQSSFPPWYTFSLSILSGLQPGFFTGAHRSKPGTKRWVNIGMRGHANVVDTRLFCGVGDWARGHAPPKKIIEIWDPQIVALEMH